MKSFRYRRLIILLFIFQIVADLGFVAYIWIDTAWTNRIMAMLEFVL
ncbi:hypothetical protein ACN4EK_24280 [Pantanalinema rosaneae CENA516]